jgi:Cdc6-like AAA superfamily ATPase
MAWTQNLWERYGFSDNPFDTGALSLSNAARLMDAYVARGDPSNAASVLTNFLRNPGGGRIVVEGEPGVGKTTFVNFHRHQWGKKLLSPATEISVQENWTERDFLLSLLNSLSSRLRLDMGSKEFARDALLQEVTAITGVRVEQGGGFSANVTVIGTGGGFGKTSSSSVKVGELTNGRLREYLSRLIARVREKRGFSGVIFHLDNLELLARDGDGNLRRFFEAIRDTLQEPSVYFIFVGYKGMFQQVIVPSARVRSIFFDTPVYLEPLDLPQVREVIEKRYRLLAVPNKEWIKPVEDEVIDHLYQTFAGKIRYVMNAITSLITHIPDSYAKPLNLSEATKVLRSIQLSEIKRSLSEAEVGVFLQAVKQGRFTNSSLGGETGKSKQLIQKHLSKLLEFHYVYHAEKKGRSQYYEVEPRFGVLAGNDV